MSTAETPAPLQVGIILLSDGVQLLDVSSADILGMMQPSYLRACSLPESIIAQGVEMEFHYVTESGEGMQAMTAGFRLGVTDSIATCPPLDILILGGPSPAYVPSPAVISFLRTQLAHCDAFMTVCTGIFPALHAGTLSGRAATGPKGLLPLLGKQHPDVKWERKRWVRDGKIWTSGTITNGLDSMAAFMRERFADRAGL
ncbi:MAG: hypothetical protein Q9187_003589, partial [Circinaria calcarea]